MTLGLEEVEPVAISAYIEELGTEIAKPSVKQHLAAIRQLFDYLVTGGVLVSTPAGSVRGPKFVVTRGKTPVLSGAEMRQLLKSIDTAELIGLRDRSLLGLMGYTFARVTAAFDDYNKAARGEQPDAFGRRDFALAPLVPPLYICRVVPGLFHTQGGLMVDIDGRVLRANGTPIANLFAGGGAAAGLSGRTGAAGYASGNGLLSAIGLGRLSGLAATREIAREAA